MNKKIYIILSIMLSIISMIIITPPALATEQNSITLNVQPGETKIGSTTNSDEYNSMNVKCGGTDSNGIQRHYCQDIYTETIWWHNRETGALEQGDTLSCSIGGWTKDYSYYDEKEQCGDVEITYCIWTYDMNTLDPIQGAIWHNKTLGDSTPSDKDGKLCWHKDANPPEISEGASSKQTPQFDWHDESFTEVKAPSNVKSYQGNNFKQFTANMTSSGRISSSNPPYEWSGTSPFDWSDVSGHIDAIRYQRNGIKSFALTGKKEITTMIPIIITTIALMIIMGTAGRNHKNNGLQI